MVGMFQDEKNLAVLALISGTFILVTLSGVIGNIYFAMAAVYAITLNLGKERVLQFSKQRGVTSTAIFAFLLIGGFVAVGAIVLGGQEQLFAASSFFASSFLLNFTIEEPIIKLIVFGFFIPIVETLFFFGVIYALVLRRTKATGKLNDIGTLVAIVMVAGIATAFHFSVRLLNDSSLIADLIFFGLSAMIISRQGEMSGAAFGHVATNTIFVGQLLGFFRLF